MSIRKNILANYVGTGAVAIAPILALPWYLDALGASQFGLIGFIMMLQIMFGLVDAGMSQALVREISIRFAVGEAGGRDAATLLFGFERIYWLFSLVAALVMYFLSDLITYHWLNLGGVSESLGKQAVVGAAVLFAVQFPGSIYRSTLVATQAQVSLNVIMSIFSLLRHIGAVLILFQWPLLIAYLAWHCALALLETLVRACFAWASVTTVRRKELRWSSAVLKDTWVIVTTMSAATLLGVLTIHMDKLILSNMVPIDQFGYYVIAASVSLGVLQVINPLIQAALPRMLQMQADRLALRVLSLKLFKLIVLIVIVGCLGFVFAGQWLLNLWLGNAQTVAVVFPVLSVLLIGSAFNALYNIGYINWIVHEQVRNILRVNALALVLSLLLTPVLVSWLGVIGAAVGWVVINLIGFVLSLEWVRRYESA